MQQKLRIAIVCDSIDTTLGGSIVSAQRFAQWLAERGHDIVWIVSKFVDETRKKDFPCAAMYEFPTFFPLWPQKTRFAYTSVASLTKAFNQEKIDIVYSIHPSLIWRQAIRAAKRIHIPVVSHSHIRPDLLVPGAPRFIQKCVKKIIAYIYKQSDGLISPTTFTQEIFKDCNITTKQIVISNGVDTEIYKPSHSKSQQTFEILSVGRLDPEKNIDLLIQALHLLHTQKKLLPHVHCTIVGAWSQAKRLHTLVDENNLSSIVTCIGKMNSNIPGLIHLYQQASVFVLPSMYELEWMVVLEAMACGCPLLIANSPTSAAKEFVHNNGYTFDPKNPQDLADKIYQLSTNPELCKLMGNISQEQSKNYSFLLSVKKLESFFYSFIQHK